MDDIVKYESSFNYGEFELESEEREYFIEKEQRLINLGQRVIKTTLEIGKELSEVQDKISSKNKNNGMFFAWFENLGLNKNYVYREINRWKMFEKYKIPAIAEASIRTLDFVSQYSDKVAEEEIEERVLSVLKTCGLYEFRKWPISALSFGQKKRVTIASILVLGPEIILLDEPTAGQDQRNYTEIMNFLDELNQQGHTIIMITHDMQLMLDYSDRAIVVVDGKVLADKSPAQVLTDKNLIAEANLKETSIFTLAKKLGVDPLALTEFYMQEKGRSHVSR